MAEQITHIEQAGATCHWAHCEATTTEVCVIELTPPGSTVVRPPRRIPLCPPHIVEMELTRRVNLKYHPDDVPPGDTFDHDEPWKPPSAGWEPNVKLDLGYGVRVLVPRSRAMEMGQDEFVALWRSRVAGTHRQAVAWATEQLRQREHAVRRRDLRRRSGRSRRNT